MKFFLLLFLSVLPVFSGTQEETLKRHHAHGTFTAAMHAYAQGDKELSEALFAKAIETDPKLARARFHLGDIYFEKGDFQKAIFEYEACLSLSPDYVFAYFNLACAKARIGEIDAGIAAIRRAVQLGYNRAGMLKSDQDLAPLRQSQEFSKIIESIKPQSESPVLTAFILSDPSGKIAILQAKAESRDWEEYACLAQLDSEVEVRRMSYLVYAHCEADAEKKVVQLAKGLFDVNGYVNKAAANALVVAGDAALPWMQQIERSNYDGAKFYSPQIIRLIRAKSAEAK